MSTAQCPVEATIKISLVFPDLGRIENYFVTPDPHENLYSIIRGNHPLGERPSIKDAVFHVMEQQAAPDQIRGYREVVLARGIEWDVLIFSEDLFIFERIVPEAKKRQSWLSRVWSKFSDWLFQPPGLSSL